MKIYDWGQMLLYFAILIALVKPLGGFMARVYQGERTFVTPVLGPVERLIYRVTGVFVDDSMDWKRYAFATLVFNLIGLVVVYELQRLQGMLPLNPQQLGAVSPDSAWNTAISFVTNTNWQGYGGESTMSYLTQMLGLAVQNFVSAATGIAVMAAFVRGLARHNAATVGSFWADLVRSTLYVLLPLSFLFAIFLVSQGVIQNFKPYETVQTLETATWQVPKVGPDGQPVKDVESLKGIMQRIATEKKAFVVMKVVRGIHTAYLELEPAWKK